MSYNRASHLFRLPVVLLLAVSLAACGGDDGEVTAENNTPGENNAPGENNTPGAAIEVEGTWDTPYGTVEVITSEKWDFMTIVKYDNAARYAITQSPSDDEYNPDKFNRLVWTKPADDSFYYCWVDFGLDTAEEAENSENVADASDLEGEGCNGFEWTKLTRAEAQ